MLCPAQMLGKIPDMASPCGVAFVAAALFQAGALASVNSQQNDAYK